MSAEPQVIQFVGSMKRRLTVLVSEERKLAARITELKEKQDALRARIREHLGDTPQVFAVDSHTVRLAEVTTKRFDLDEFEEHHPNLAEQFTRIETTLRLTIR